VAVKAGFFGIKWRLKKTLYISEKPRPSEKSHAVGCAATMDHSYQHISVPTTTGHDDVSYGYERGGVCFGDQAQNALMDLLHYLQGRPIAVDSWRTYLGAIFSLSWIELFCYMAPLVLFVMLTLFAIRCAGYHIRSNYYRWQLRNASTAQHLSKLFPPVAQQRQQPKVKRLA
jgi:hypothetical protein